jgi:hypothetical protein
LCVIVLAGATPSAAEQSNPRWQLSISGVWTGSSSLGSQAATETANQTSPTRYTLFATQSEVQASFGLEARLTCWLTRTLGAEVGASWSRPRLVTSISGDVEGGPNTTASSDVNAYAIDGGVTVRLNRLAFAGDRVVPYATAGVGYLRDAYEGRALIETGTLYRAGGGVLWWVQPLRSGGIRRVGLRADAQWTRHNGGVTLGGSQSRSFATVIVGAALSF